MHKHETKRLKNGEVVHSVFRGEVDQFDMIAAIMDWSRLLLEDNTIRFVIFDCTEATCSKLSSTDLQVIARQTAALLINQKDLIMVGVMNRKLDFGLFRMWETFMSFGTAHLKENQTLIVKSLDQAHQYIDEFSATPIKEVQHSQPNHRSLS